MVPDLNSYCRFETRFEIDICYFDINAFIGKNFPQNVNSRIIKNQDIAEFVESLNFFDEDDILKVSSFKSFKRQIEWISGRIGIKLLAAGKFSVSDCKSIKIAREDGGAPFLPDYTDAEISISHSSGLALSGLSTGKKFGIDAEFIKADLSRNEIMNIAFTDTEKLQTAENEELFFEIWTAKEAYLKYIKKGFAESLKKIEISGDNIFKNGVLQQNIFLKRWIYGDYKISLIY